MIVRNCDCAEWVVHTMGSWSSIHHIFLAVMWLQSGHSATGSYMLVATSRNHVIAICNIPWQLSTSRVYEEARRKVASYSSCFFPPRCPPWYCRDLVVIFVVHTRTVAPPSLAFIHLHCTTTHPGAAQYLNIPAVSPLLTGRQQEVTSHSQWGLRLVIRNFHLKLMVMRTARIAVTKQNGNVISCLTISFSDRNFSPNYCGYVTTIFTIWYIVVHHISGLWPRKFFLNNFQLRQHFQTCWKQKSALYICNFSSSCQCIQWNPAYILLLLNSLSERLSCRHCWYSI